MRATFDKITRVWDAFFRESHFRITLRLTLLLLMLHAAANWLLLVPLQILCGIMLVSRSLDQSRRMWLAIVAAVIGINLWDWYRIDNHKYLIMYWALACFLSLYSRNPERLLAWNARLLIGLTFLFAVIWKLIGGEYLDGTFFSFTLLSVEPIEKLVMLLSGLGLNELSSNRDLLLAVKLFPAEESSFVLSSNPGIGTLSMIFSYATLLIEGAIAVGFLAGDRGAFSAFRDDLLILFCLLTYYALPIVGFAFVLIVMGLAQCPDDRSELRKWYMWVFVVVQLSMLPYGSIFSQLGF